MSIEFLVDGVGTSSRLVKNKKPFRDNIPPIDKIVKTLTSKHLKLKEFGIGFYAGPIEPLVEYLKNEKAKDILFDILSSLSTNPAILVPENYEEHLCYSGGKVYFTPGNYNAKVMPIIFSEFANEEQKESRKTYNSLLLTAFYIKSFEEMKEQEERGFERLEQELERTKALLSGAEKERGRKNFELAVLNGKNNSARGTMRTTAGISRLENETLGLDQDIRHYSGRIKKLENKTIPGQRKLVEKYQKFDIGKFFEFANDQYSLEYALKNCRRGIEENFGITCSQPTISPEYVDVSIRKTKTNYTPHFYRAAALYFLLIAGTSFILASDSTHQEQRKKTIAELKAEIVSKGGDPGVIDGLVAGLNEDSRNARFHGTSPHILIGDDSGINFKKTDVKYKYPGSNAPLQSLNFTYEKSKSCKNPKTGYCYKLIPELEELEEGIIMLQISATDKGGQTNKILNFIEIKRKYGKNYYRIIEPSKPYTGH